MSPSSTRSQLTKRNRLTSRGRYRFFHEATCERLEFQFMPILRHCTVKLRASPGRRVTIDLGDAARKSAKDLQQNVAVQMPRIAETKDKVVIADAGPVQPCL